MGRNHRIILLLSDFISGLVLGGGVGRLSRMFGDLNCLSRSSMSTLNVGLTLDNIVSLDIVLVESLIFDA